MKPFTLALVGGKDLPQFVFYTCKLKLGGTSQQKDMWDAETNMI